MKNIAVLVNSLRFGGAEVQTVELANSLAAKEYNVLVLSLGQEKEIHSRIAQGIQVVLLNKQQFLDFHVLKTLIQHLRRFKPDALIMANSYSTLYGYMAHFFVSNRFKMISVQHTTLIQGAADRLKNLVYRRVINRMDRVIFVCNNQKKHWVENYGIRDDISSVIYNGIDIDRFTGFRTDVQRIREELGFKPTDIVIGINANLRPEKKHEHMIDALEMLLREGYPIKLLFIGDGVRRKSIESYIAEKKLGEHVKITGFLQDVRPFLSSVDIAALTSVAVETLSIAILESMALGKPVILSDIGGARELVDIGENGMIYEAGDVEALVQAIRFIADNGHFESMGRRSRIKVMQTFSKAVMVERYIEILEDKAFGGVSHVLPE